jgi:phenylalanyl-tRNA synthetase beta subunit
MGVATYAPYTKEVNIQRRLEDILVRTFHCNQIETYPRINEKTIQEFGKDKNDFYSLQNPTSPEAPYLRDDIGYGLLAQTAKNSKFFDRFAIFDIGKIWTK